MGNTNSLSNRMIESGDDFVDQARSMNEGTIKEKSIYGHGTKDEIEQLKDEGINVINLPWTPEDH